MKVCCPTTQIPSYATNIDCLSQWRGEPKFSTALSGRKYYIGKEEKSGQNQPPRSLRAGTAQRGAPIFYRARAERIFLAALSPREFRRATEAGSWFLLEFPLNNVDLQNQARFIIHHVHYF